MLRGRRALWALILAILLISMHNPRPGFCVEEDLYVYRSIVGTVFFEYDKSTVEQSSAKRDTDRFTQLYRLDMKGNIMSRRLIIYDAGVSVTDTDTNTAESTVNSNLKSYYLRTTILPKSSIPLTLYGSVNNSEITTTGTQTSTLSTLGLNWFLNLKTLPVTTINAERTTNESDTTEIETTLYRVTAEKKIGPTSNILNFSTSQTEENNESGASMYALNFNNTTSLSKRTQILIGATKSESENPGQDPSTLNGLSLGLVSVPSLEFRQNHHFTYYSNKSGADEQTGSTYSGNMQYRFSERVTSSLQLSESTALNESATSTYETESLSTSGNINYKVNKNLTLTESVQYSVFHTNSSDPSLNLGDRSYYKIITTASYMKQLERAQLTTSYGLGYTEEKNPDGETGSGIEHQFSLGLSGININKYVGFNTAYSRNWVQTLSGENFENYSEAYSLDAYNKEWKKYVLLNARYTKSKSESWISVLAAEAEAIRFDANSSYFKNTTLNLMAQRTNSTNEISGPVQIDTKSFTALHSRPFWGGIFGGTFNYVLTDSESGGEVQRSSSNSLGGRFTKQLMRNLSWDINAERTASDTSGVKSKRFTLQNSFIYPFRSWFLSAEHKYSVSESDTRETKESRVIFRAARTFFAIF